MPLPADGSPFPSEELRRVYDKLSVWSAWYSGDGEYLHDVYSAGSARRSSGVESTFDVSRSGAGSSSGQARFFWGQPLTPGTERVKLHVPLPADISVTSADLLFSEPPSFTCENPQTQMELDILREDGRLDSTLLEAAEVASALTGVFLRVSWDTTIRSKPFITAVHPDCAMPEFKFGVLTAVTFWDVMARGDGGKVWRLLERHEPGYILHGLYRGTEENLGAQVPLSSLPETATLQPAVPVVPERLTAVYIPNMRPTRCWRGSRQYSALGRSDYAGVEHLFDALDESYTSWMRDVRLGKARLVVPSAYLESAGRGLGAAFDADREYFQSFEVIGDQQMQIEQVQFAIRVDEHERTCNNLVQQIVRAAGYSAYSLGESTDMAITATEVVARERRSLITRGKKIRYWGDGLAQILEVLLLVDATIFGGGFSPEIPRVEFPSAVKEQPLALAQTIKTLDEASVVSTETKVRMLHPEWPPEQVDAEVAALGSARTAEEVM